MEGLRLVAVGGSPWRRLALPAAFLLAATIAVALVRMELQSDDPAPGATAAATEKPAKQKAAPAEPRFYAVKAGDTLESIAQATGVPVARLRELNPSLEPTALFIGAKIRLR